MIRPEHLNQIRLIDPTSVEDPKASHMVGLVLNGFESLLDENGELKHENQRLKDEIARLKGEQGKPYIKPNKSDKSNTPDERGSR